MANIAARITQEERDALVIKQKEALSFRILREFAQAKTINVSLATILRAYATEVDRIVALENSPPLP